MAIQDFNLINLNGGNGFRLNGVSTHDRSARSVNNAGDVNGDGFDDVIIGAPSADPHGEASGSSYVLFGKADGFDAQINLSGLDGNNGFRLDGANENDVSGLFVSTAGDVNGDGFDDVIISANGADPNGTDSGSSYVVFGKAGGFAATLELSSLDGSNGFRLDGENPHDYAGTVSSAGDINGDGFADLVIGVSGTDTNGNASGSSYIVFGKGSNFDAVLDLTNLDGRNGFRLVGSLYDQLGHSVSSAGDVNGDGFDDVIMGAEGYSFSYVLFGKANGFAATMDLSSLDGHDGFRLDGAGTSVSSVGDVNGDGFDDVIVTGVNITNASGSCYVIFGSNTGFDATLDVSDLDGSNGFRLDGENADFGLGWTVSDAGDINGDGIDDLLIGAPISGIYHEDSGTSYVVLGRTSGFDAQIDLSDLNGRNGFRLNGENLGDYAGSSVSGAGDVNNDGFDDLIIGTDITDGGTGSSYVIFGSADVTGNQSLTEIAGTAAADHLQGTTAAEYLSAGADDDMLAGGGGADKFDGGEGDDVISLADLDFAAIDGGAGNDTLQLSGSGMNLDFTQLKDQIHHVENIDLYGKGDNSLTLTADSVPNFTEVFGGSGEILGGFSSLTIQGSQGDRVRILDANWVDVGVDDGYHTYKSLKGTLHVREDVQVDFVQGVEHSFNLASLDGTNGFRLDGENIDDRFGNSVSDAGDVNGDGFDDVIVSAPGVKSHGNPVGSSYVVFGRVSGFDANISVSGLDGSNGFRLDGSSGQVSSAGDINGDGFGDVIIGAGDDHQNGSDSGISHVVFGKASGFDPSMNLSSLDGNNGFHLDGPSTSVSSAGDINGDGVDDLIVGGLKLDSNGHSIGSSSYIVFGKNSGFTASIDLSGLNGNDGFRLDGSSGPVSSAGDVNGDGIADLIIGAPNADSNAGDSGSSYIVFGKASGFGAQMDLSSLNGHNGFRLDGENKDDLSGSSVSDAGDINGDGFDDVIIGATGADFGGEHSGSSYVVFGHALGFDAAIDLSSLDGRNGFRLDSKEAFNYSGGSVSGAGDINGDGYDDLIIGSSTDYFLSHSYVIFGKASGFDAQISLNNLTSDGFRLDDDNPMIFGSSVSGAGDINGDGLDDLVVGAPKSVSGSEYYTAGRSYVIFGSRDFGSGGGGSELPEIVGTDDADTLKGSEAAEHFIAGDGNDNLLGRGGADVFDAGAGDDAIRIGDLTFASIDGGDGNDALHLAGSGMNLDLSVLGDQIHNIETICLYGRGDNTLTLTAESLLDLSSSTDTLKVHGNSGDHIVVQDDGWVDGGNQGFYHTYTHDDAVLLVGANVAVEFA